MQTNQSLLRRHVSRAACLLSLTLATKLPAANWAWSTAPANGNVAGNNWTSGTTPGAATATPVSGDSLYFGTSSLTTLTNNASAFTFGGLTFNAGASAFIINSNSFTLSGGITNNSANPQAINTPVVLSGGNSLAGTGNLTLGGIVSGSGTLAMVGTGLATLSAANTASGAITVSAGELDIYGWGTAAVTVGNSATTATLGIKGGTLALGANTFTLGNGTSSAYAGIVNQTAGTVSFTSGTAMIVGNGSGGAGTYNLSGGTLTSGSFSSTSRGVMLGVNNGCSATFNLSGTGSLLLSSAELAVGRDDSAVTNCTVAYNQSGGTATIGYLSIGGQSGSTTTTAAFTISNGTFAANNFQRLVAAASSSANLTLGGAAQVILPAFPVPTGTANLTLDFTTGFLAPAATSPAYLGGLTHAYLTANGVNFNVGTGTNISVSQVFQDKTTGGTFTKSGLGTLSLSGVSTYTGVTTVKAGELAGVTGGSLVNSAVAVTPASGVATLGVLYTGGNAQWTCGSLTFNAGGSGTGLEFAFVTPPSPTTAPLNVAGNLTFGVTPALTVDVANVGVGVYPLVVVGGSAPSAVPVLNWSPASRQGSTSGTLAWGGSGFSAKTLVLTVTSIAEPLVWSSASAPWDVNDSTNLVWKSGATPTATYYQQGTGLLNDQVVFADTYITANPAVALNSTVTPAGVTFNNSTYSYTLSGTGGISGATALLKSGTNAVTLSTPNTYTGGTVINAGTVNTGVAGGLGNAGVTLASAATLNLTAGGVTYNSLNAGINGSGTVNITTGSGSGAVLVNGTNAGFNGILNVGVNSTGGKIQLNGALGSGTTVNILSNSTVYVNGATQTCALVLNGGITGEAFGQARIEANAVWAGPLTLAGPVIGGTNGTIGANSGTGYLTGPIGQTNGVQSLIKIGGGTDVLSGTNTYSGPTVVNQGTLTVLGNQTLATGGYLVSTNSLNGCALNLGGSTQTVPTTALVTSGQAVQVGNTVAVGTGFSTITIAGASGFPTFVTNNGTLWCGRDSGFTVNPYATWIQNGDLTIEEQGGYVANYTISAGGTFIYAGPDPINATVGGSALDNMIISGTLLTAQGFTFNDLGTSYPLLTLSSGGVIALSANIPQFITTAGSGTLGRFLVGTNAVINTAGYSTAIGLPLGNVASQTGSLVKSGAGTLELDAVNTYTGPTTVSGGTLLLGASAVLNSGTIVLTNNGTLDVSAQGTYSLAPTNILSGNGTIIGSVADSAGTQFYPGGSGPIGTLNFNANLTLAGGDTLNFDFSNGGSNDVVIVGGALLLNGTTTLNLAKWPLTSGFKVGSYVLLQVTNGIGGSGSFVLFNAPGRQNCNLVINTVGAVQQVVLTVGNSGAPASLAWAGGQNNNAWDTQTTANWLNSASPDYFFSGDSVTFGNVPAANAQVNIAAPAVAPGPIVFTGTNNYLLASSGGYITGIASLTQNGPGSVTLATANDYSGGTVINGGSLILGDGTANNGSILGNITDNGTLAVANPNDATLANNISGSGSVFAAGPGVLTLTGNNSYNGGTLINSNTTLVATAPGALGLPVTNNVISVGANGVLSLHAAGNFTLTNWITGSGALVQHGANGTTLLNSNGFSGGVTIELGAVIVGNSNALGTGPILIDNQGAGAGAYAQLFLKNGVTLTNAITLGTASSYFQGLLMVDAGGYAFGGANGSGTGSDTNGATFAGPITYAPGTVGHGGQFCGPNSGNSWLFITGPVTNTGGSVVVRNGRVQLSGAGDYAGLTVAAGLTSLGANNGVCTNAALGIAASGNATFDLRGFNQAFTELSSSATYTAIITNSSSLPATLAFTPTSSTYGGSIGGNINLVVNGSGILSLTATNHYTGNTTINGGTLELAYLQLATNATVTIASGATLQLDDATTNLVGSLVLAGVSQPAGVYNSANTPAITGAGSLVVAASGPGTFTNPTGITGINLNGGILALTATNGQAGCAYYLLTTTNVAAPVNQWTVVATNVLKAAGAYTFVGTNVFIPAAAQQYFMLSSTNYNH